MTEPIISAIIDEFSLFDDWEDKYAYLIDLGKALPTLAPEQKIEVNRVHGCTSTVWLIAKQEQNGIIVFMADSDAYIVKGLVALLLRVYSNKTPAEINAIEIEALFKELGLEKYLSPSRSNGFFAIVKRIKDLSKIS